QRFRIWRLSLQQTGKGVVSWRLPFGLAPGGFCAGEYLLTSYEKVDVIQVIAFEWVHILSNSLPIELDLFLQVML
ncbi:hypothetical protein HKBW3S47_01970, partial [Candidatus Hakubella thermalkaliphila]